MSLIVAHPGTQHSVHAARELKRAGLLRFLFTSVSLKRPRWMGPLLRVVAPAVHERLSQHRGHIDFAPDEIRIDPVHEVTCRFGERAWIWAQARFGRLAGRMGVRERCGVMAFNTGALETFRILRRDRLPCVLDQTIAHRRWSTRVGQQACDENPEWGDRWTASAERIAREEEEIDLADVVLCGSEFCARTMREEGVQGRKIAVVEYGTDTARFAPAADPRSPRRDVRLLFVGALAVRKGIHLLLEAARRLQGLEVSVTAVGRSRVSMRKLASYGSLLRLEGFRLHRDMPDLYRQHDLYVFPSLVEGSSLSVYEALASGLPVITTENAGSIVRDGVEGTIVRPGDVEALTAAIEALARDPERRRAMAVAARKRAETYGDWRHYGERLVRAITPLAGTPG